jgi:hypothetical protein
LIHVRQIGFRHFAELSKFVEFADDHGCNNYADVTFGATNHEKWEISTTMDTACVSQWLRVVLLFCGLACAVTSTGCQVTAGGQTLPSSNYLDDDVQYFAPGPEFLLPKEAATMRTFTADQAAVAP